MWVEGLKRPNCYLILVLMDIHASFNSKCREFDSPNKNALEVRVKWFQDAGITYLQYFSMFEIADRVVNVGKLLESCLLPIKFKNIFMPTGDPRKRLKSDLSVFACSRSDWEAGVLSRCFHQNTSVN